MRSIARVEKISLNSVVRLLDLAGEACDEYHFEHVREISGKRRIECDEIWSFIYAKEKNAEQAKPLDVAGTVWTFTAIDSKTKLLISYLVSTHRRTSAAKEFFIDLDTRLEKDPRIITDELPSYKNAAKQVFGKRAKRILNQTKKGSDSTFITSYVERHNLTIRMKNRRYARKTNAFSKTMENHVKHFHLYALHYNFCRVHMSLGTTPAIAAGLENRVRTCRWIARLIEKIEPEPMKPGPAPGTIYKSKPGPKPKKKVAKKKRATFLVARKKVTRKKRG